MQNPTYYKSSYNPSTGSQLKYRRLKNKCLVHKMTQGLGSFYVFISVTPRTCSHAHVLSQIYGLHHLVVPKYFFETIEPFFAVTEKNGSMQVYFINFLAKFSKLKEYLVISISKNGCAMRAMRIMKEAT